MLISHEVGIITPIDVTKVSATTITTGVTLTFISMSTAMHSTSDYLG
jgi:hypothetical protein